MSHTRIMDKDARIIKQCAAGRFIRNVNSINLLVAGTRLSGNATCSHPSADIVDGETMYKTVFVAPSAATVESIYAVPIQRAPSFGSGYALYLDIYKAHPTAGQDIQINTSGSLRIGGSADLSGVTIRVVGTAYDATIATGSSNISLLAGQAVYVTATQNSGSNMVAGSGPGYVNLNVEWAPNDRTYASP